MSADFTTDTTTNDGWPQQRAIKEPLPNDVLSGRGARTNRHNEGFRAWVGTFKKEYAECKKHEKTRFAYDVVWRWQNHQDPPGRFLKEGSETDTWYECSDDEAKKKVIQLLRDSPMDPEDPEETSEFKTETSSHLSMNVWPPSFPASSSPWSTLDEHIFDEEIPEMEEQVTLSKLGPYDILCGKGKGCHNNVGNRHYRDFITNKLPQYMDGVEKSESSKTISAIVDEFFGKRFRFFDKVNDGDAPESNNNDRLLVQLDRKECRTKIAHALRDGAKKRKLMNEEELKKRVTPTINNLSKDLAAAGLGGTDAVNEHPGRGLHSEPKCRRLGQQHGSLVSVPNCRNLEKLEDVIESTDRRSTNANRSEESPGFENLDNLDNMTLSSPGFEDSYDLDNMTLSSPGFEHLDGLDGMMLSSEKNSRRSSIRSFESKRDMLITVQESRENMSSINMLSFNPLALMSDEGDPARVVRQTGPDMMIPEKSLGTFSHSSFSLKSHEAVPAGFDRSPDKMVLENSCTDMSVEQQQSTSSFHRFESPEAKRKYFRTIVQEIAENIEIVESDPNSNFLERFITELNERLNVESQQQCS